MTFIINTLCSGYRKRTGGRRHRLEDHRFRRPGEGGGRSGGSS